MMTKNQAESIIIGSGGTGGHMFPAAAIANQLRSKGYKIILITDKRGMRYGNDFKDDHIIELPIVNIRKSGSLEKIKGMLQLLKSIYMSVRIIIKHKPKAMIGFGGYPSFPAATASIITRVPLFLHEQNAILGRTNKFLKRFAYKVFTSFKSTQFATKSHKVIHTGNPVRASVHHYKEIPYPEITKNFNILVTGGSQGASVFSQMMPEICQKLPKDLAKKLFVTHQARPEDIKTTKEAYEKYAIQANIVSFIDDMGQEIAKSHLVICRSGATTLAEIGLIGRPALYVPLPSSADDQQTINAQIATNLGAGRLIRQENFTPSYVASIITAYYMQPTTLHQAAEKAKLLTNKDACHNVAQIIIDKVQNN
ncbi:MAG: UDP-N-acetylglucosamine--N-acetylmuramyl-(pentapeptide) pyrophosphoryl-undecaprenol N-acetylglucosamine transferase [Alphaproteobacteria bacterium]|jgi:UDP-N-acetylglucosamine--N-acetylmuramyl-(pentapeptide) pyrophosphoryl-undecaprenol N-acetylglucosamine transferase